MSNTSTNYAELNVTNDDMKEMLAEGNGSAEKKSVPAKKKNIGYRILAVILTLAPVCLFFLSVNVLITTQTGYAMYDKATLWDAVLALFKKDGLSKFYADAAETVSGAAASGFDAFKLFGLPTLSGSGVVGKVTGLILYAFPVVWVLTLIFMIIAIFSSKASPALARAIALLNCWLYAGYTIVLLVISAYYPAIPATYDIVLLAFAAAYFLIYFVLSAIRAGKASWLNLLLCLLTIGFAAALMYGVTECVKDLTVLFKTKDAYKTVIVVLFGVLAVALAISSFRMSRMKGYTFDLLRYILNFAIAIAAIVMTFIVKEFDSLLLYAAIAAACALVQIILVSIVLSAKKKAAKKAAAKTVDETTTKSVEEAPEAQPVTEAEMEKEAGVYAEAVRYEGYPETEAPEAQPLDAPAPQPYVFSHPEEEEVPANKSAATADYDFYNSRSFDPFIASLNSKEREQFTEIFILKYKGDTKNLPDYEVGGDNSEFFRKVFIYLGQYRDRIPDSLLGKMYQFAVKK